MGVKKFLASAVTMITGFVINQIGFFVVLRQPILIDWLSPDLFGLGLEFGGGLILIIGFIMFISNALSESRLIGRPVTRKASGITGLKRCKFCGAVISEAALFCPVCQKSQE